MNNILTNDTEIIAWLTDYGIQNYTLIPSEQWGWTVDVRGSVFLINKSLTRIKVKFNSISGIFDCSNNLLTSLHGSPDSVGQYFSCEHNRLTTLEHCPQIIGRDFLCSDNQLRTLAYIPQKVGGAVVLRGNRELDYAQSIYDWDKIYPIHLEHKIIEEHRLLNEKNIFSDIPGTPKINKI